MKYYTYQDAIQHLMDFCGGNNVSASEREIHLAALNAYVELVELRKWRYMHQRGRIDFCAPVSGTCSSSGAVFSITSGTWPSWSAGGTLKIGVVNYPVLSMNNAATQLTVGVTGNTNTDFNPIADSPALTAFTIYKNIYTLPDNWREMYSPSDESNRFYSQYIDADSWHRLDRYTFATGSPTAWTIMQAPLPQDIGRYAIYVWPYPDGARTFDFIYQRWARELNVSGFASADQGGAVANSANTITGIGTTFNTTTHPGTVLRVSADATVPDVIGPNKYAFERLVHAVTDTSHLTYYGTDIGSVSGRGFVLSDPLDMPLSMMTAYWRNAERHLCIAKSLPQLPNINREYAQGLAIAKGADSPSMSGQSAWDIRPRLNTRLGRQPLGPDA